MVIFYNFSKGGRYLIVSEVLSWKGFWKVLTLNINKLGNCLLIKKDRVLSTSRVKTNGVVYTGGAYNMDYTWDSEITPSKCILVWGGNHLGNYGWTITLTGSADNSWWSTIGTKTPNTYYQAYYTVYTVQNMRYFRIRANSSAGTGSYEETAFTIFY